MGTIETYTNSHGRYWFDSYSSTVSYGPTPAELAEAERRRERIARLCREAIESLKDWHSKAHKPWLLIAKRFDFRAAPRWSALRWKAKT